MRDIIHRASLTIDGSDWVNKQRSLAVMAGDLLRWEIDAWSMVVISLLGCAGWARSIRNLCRHLLGHKNTNRFISLSANAMMSLG